MATKKVGDLIKEARTNAGLSQEKLATAIDGLSASDVGKAERGEKDLTNEQLKAIAKMTGVTQKSLLEAPKNIKTTAAKTSTSTAKTSTAKTSTSTAKTSTAKTSGKTTSTTGKTTAAKTTGKTTSTTAGKTSTAKTSTTGKTTAAKTSSSTSSTGTSMKVSATEKKLVELYRAADSDTKKKVMNVLKGKEEEGGDFLNSLLGEILKK